MAVNSGLSRPLIGFRASYQPSSFFARASLNSPPSRAFSTTRAPIERPRFRANDKRISGWKKSFTEKTLVTLGNSPLKYYLSYDEYNFVLTHCRICSIFSYSIFFYWYSICFKQCCYLRRQQHNN